VLACFSFSTTGHPKRPSVWLEEKVENTSHWPQSWFDFVESRQRKSKKLTKIRNWKLQSSGIKLQRSLKWCIEFQEHKFLSSGKPGLNL
jgi:hypothetical protein